MGVSVTTHQMNKNEWLNTIDKEGKKEGEAKEIRGQKMEGTKRKNILMNKWKASNKMICYSIGDNYHKDSYKVSGIF